MNTATPIVNETPGRAIDTVLLKRQVGMWTWAEIGTKWDTALRRHDALQVDIRTGPRRTHRLFIKLTADDLFDLEIGQMRKPPKRRVHAGGVDMVVAGRLPEYVVVEQVRGVDAENLPTAVRALFARHAAD